MTSFSIDDVRETMPREVTAFLASIDQAAVAFLKAHPAEPGGMETRESELLRTIRHCGHAIYGTSSLVSVNPLAECADLVERLAERGHAELMEAEARVARARRVVSLLPTGVEQMRTVLELALKHEADDAEWLVAEWQAEASKVLAELAPAPQRIGAPSLHPAADPELDLVSGSAPKVLNVGEHGASADLSAENVDATHRGVAAAIEHTELAVAKGQQAEEFSFEDWEPVSSTPIEVVPDLECTADAPAVTPASEAQRIEPSLANSEPDEEFRFDEEAATNGAGTAALQFELISIFQEEARDAVVALQGYLNALGGDNANANADAAAPLERIYHTLKGAAATVGLAEVSRRAENLQLRAEALIGLMQPVDEVILSGFVDDTNQLFALSGLAEIQISVSMGATTESGAPGPEVAAIFPEFLAEAREIYDQAATLVAELSSPFGAKYTQSMLATLAPLFHRLTGSARLVGETQVAEYSASLEEECNGSSPPTTANLSLGLARIAAKLGFAHAAASPDQRSQQSRIESATQDAFECEARELVDNALRLTRDLRGATSEAASPQDAQSELAKLFHHLGGSARIVGNAAVAEEATALEGLVSESASVSLVDLSTLDERLSALRASFASESQASFDTSAVPSRNVREAVDLTHVDELWQTFTTECAELIESIEHGAYALEESSTPKEQLKKLMRLVHTLKGVVNTIGLAPTGRILHRVEDLLEMLIAASILPPARRIANLLVEVQSDVKRNLKEARTGFVETSPQRLEARIAALSTAGGATRAQGAPTQSERVSEARPSAGRDTSAASVGDGADRRVIRVATERLDALMNLAGELVVSRSRLTSRVQRLRVLQSELAHGGKRLIDAVDAFREEHEFANLDGKQRFLPVTHLTNVVTQFTDDVAVAPTQSWGSFSDLELDRYEGIHVLSRSLAELASDFSELHSQLARGLSAFADDADIVGGIVSGIQTEVTRARMVPLEALFLRLRLPLHDAALRERKETRVVVSGEDVPVDKSIADALFQPMLHLVRNAVVHGIEDSDRRQRLGKPREGTVTLAARQESGQILIEVRDDGAGLDRKALHARGVEMSVLPPETPIDSVRVMDMVFVQGLSTHRTAGDVAGRGVGCEVVKRVVDRLNGSIRVESMAGQGTAFLIRLPLTLAITRALVVKNAEQSLAVPLHFAERIIDAQEQEIVRLGDTRRIKLDGTFMPIRTLAEFFGLAADADRSGPVLILRVGDARIALQVDAIVAQEEIVVKGLGALLSGHPYFSGITVRGTGELVLILDVPGLVDAKGVSIQQRGTAGLVGTDAVVATPTEHDRVQVPNRGATAKRSHARQRVLFVDDSLSVRKVAEMQLRELGVDVITAVDGLDAMAKLREEKVDVLFTDLEMPRMNGYELIRELRFLPAHKTLPIIVVTSRSGRKHQEQAKQLGASEYLTKPFTVQVLAKALSTWTQTTESQATEAGSVEEPNR